MEARLELYITLAVHPSQNLVSFHQYSVVVRDLATAALEEEHMPKQSSVRNLCMSAV